MRDRALSLGDASDLLSALGWGIVVAVALIAAGVGSAK
jgi:hypothetical protein